MNTGSLLLLYFLIRFFILKNFSLNHRKAVGSENLWRELCLSTGKILTNSNFHTAVQACKRALNETEPQQDFSNNTTQAFPSSTWEMSPILSSIRRKSLNEKTSLRSVKDITMMKRNIYREFYYHNPCVPTDIATIQEAVENCPSGGTITILPGIYFESIHCMHKQITIRAAFPEIGAAVVYHDKLSSEANSGCFHQINQPCFFVSGGTSNITISHLQTLHCSPGIDIWNGNCVVLCDDSARVHLNQCSLQSDSGRGVVVSGGGNLILTHSVIHDCAATGLYIGDQGTAASIYKSNVVENGFGSDRLLCRRRRRLHLLEEEEESWSSDEDSIDSNIVDTNESDQSQTVPPGHSGVYVETASAIINDCMISSNSLTGLSVVRRGLVQLSGSDVIENGSEAVTVEELSTFGSEMNNGRGEGGIIFGPVQNNFDKIIETNKVHMEESNVFTQGWRSRHSLFMETAHHPTTLETLRKRFQHEI